MKCGNNPNEDKITNSKFTTKNGGNKLQLLCKTGGRGCRIRAVHTQLSHCICPLKSMTTYLSLIEVHLLLISAVLLCSSYRHLIRTLDVRIACNFSIFSHLRRNGVLQTSVKLSRQTLRRSSCLYPMNPFFLTSANSICSWPPPL